MRCVSVACTLSAACQASKETIEHILWECQRAHTTWTWIASHWLGTPTDDWGWRVLQLHVIKRLPPTSCEHIWHHVVTNHGSFTPDHEEALHDIWFGLSGVCVSLLWLIRNETVHKQLIFTPDKVKTRIVDAAVKQLRAVATHRRQTLGRRLQGICMAQCLDAFESAITASPSQPRQRLTIHDGGARGNPGPGGLGWAITHEGSSGPRLLVCGSVFGGHMVTNNFCKYAGLRFKLAAARARTGRGTTDLLIVGDSKIIIGRHQGDATISHPNLKTHVDHVDNLLRHFGLVEWHHVLRKYNKMADGLANIAKNSAQ